MPHKDPFVTGRHDGQDIGLVNYADRLARVKTFTLSQCMEALSIDGRCHYLQSSVRSAIERRIRKLEKADLAQIRAEASAS